MHFVSHLLLQWGSTAAQTALKNGKSDLVSFCEDPWLENRLSDTYTAHRHTDAPTETHTDTKTETETHTQTHTQTHKQTHTHRHIHIHTDTYFKLQDVQ